MSIQNNYEKENPTKLTPALFIGHGSPMNIIANNNYTKSLAAYGEKIAPHIHSIICISAHWQTEGIKISGTSQFKQIYDFSGFPNELYKVKYAPPGNVQLSQDLLQLLHNFNAEIDDSRGLDHGVWSVLVHLFPQANIPVVQLSCNLDFKTSQHYAMAKKLFPLRKKGVLILASGNIVHSFFAYNEDVNFPPPAWGVEFDEKIKEALLKQDHDTIVRYRRIFGKSGKLSVPTEDHYVPLMYAIGVQQPEEQIHFIYEGFQNGGMSMRSLVVGDLECF